MGRPETIQVTTGLAFAQQVLATRPLPLLVSETGVGRVTVPRARRMASGAALLGGCPREPCSRRRWLTMSPFRWIPWKPSPHGVALSAACGTQLWGPGKADSEFLGM